MMGEQYLTRSEQFALVYEKGNSYAGKLLVIRALSNGLNISRYGFSISHRVGGAVVRNRIRRRLREILRKTSLRPGWDLVIIARSRAAEVNYAALGDEIGKLLSRAGLIEEYEKTGLKPD